jgi:DNA-binding MarR family transcriptional regulator
MMDKYKAIFDKAKTDNLLEINPWSALFNLRCDPCEKKAEDGDIDNNFVASPIFEDLLYKIALCQRAVKSKILIVGSHGIGKTFLLKSLKFVTDQTSSLTGKYIHSIDFFSNYYDSRYKNLDNINENNQENDFKSENVENLSDKLDQLDYLLVDDCNGEQIDKIILACKHVICFIFGMNPVTFTFQKPQECTSFEYKILDRYPIEITNLKSIVNDRFLQYSENQNSPLRIETLMSDSLFSKLYDLSFGNPSLILKIICNILRDQISEKQAKEITAQMLEFQAEMMGLITCKQYENEKVPISEKKYKILQMLYKAPSGLTPAYITEEMKVTPNNTSLHLKFLLEKRLVKYTSSGKNRIYSLTPGGEYLTERDLINKAT